MPTMRQGMAWLAGTVVVAALGSVGTYYATHQTNADSAFQQRSLASLQQFETTGAGMDQATQAFSDAMLDKRGLEDARKNLRGTVSAHSASAMALRTTFGDSETDSYVARLVAFRDAADQARDVIAMQPVWQGLSDLVAQRRRMVASAAAKIREN